MTTITHVNASQNVSSLALPAYEASPNQTIVASNTISPDIGSSYNPAMQSSSLSIPRQMKLLHLDPGRQMTSVVYIRQKILQSHRFLHFKATLSTAIDSTLPPVETGFRNSTTRSNFSDEPANDPTPIDSSPLSGHVLLGLDLFHIRGQEKLTPDAVEIAAPALSNFNENENYNSSSSRSNQKEDLEILRSKTAFQNTTGVAPARDFNTRNPNLVKSMIYPKSYNDTTSPNLDASFTHWVSPLTNFRLKAQSLVGEISQNSGEDSGDLQEHLNSESKAIDSTIERSWLDSLESSIRAGKHKSSAVSNPFNLTPNVFSRVSSEISTPVTGKNFSVDDFSDNAHPKEAFKESGSQIGNENTQALEHTDASTSTEYITSQGAKIIGIQLKDMPYSSATIEISGKQHFICLLVYATIEEIYSRGMASPGLLRNMGTEENIERLVNLFESLPPKSLAPDLSKENIHDLCGLLTRFIRGVPSPLMEPTFASLLWARCVEPDNLFSEKFIKTNETQEMKTRSQSYHKLDAAISLFKLIPDTEFTLLVFILTFLYKTTMFPHNGATARYIATQFGPHIIGPKDFQSTFSKRQVRYSMESINGSNRGAETLSWLLNNWNEIGRGLGHQRAVLLNISNALRERVDVDSKIKEEEKEELEKTSDRSSEDQSLIDVKYTPSISLQPIRVIPLKKEDHSTNPNTFSSPENSSEFETAQLYSGTDSQPSSKAVLLNFSSPNSGGNPVSEKFQAVLIKSFNGHTTTESNSLKTSSELDDIKPTTEAELKSASSASKNIFSQPKSFGFPSSENLRSNVPRTPRDFLARRKNRESLSSDSEHGMSDLDDLNKSEEGNSSNSSIEDLETIYKRSPKQKNSKKNNQYYSPSESHKSQDDPLSVTVIKAQAWAIEDAERYVKLAVERLESSERELRSTRENLASFLKQLNDLSTVPGQIL
ncbi:expressed protein [Phakopsora pachyrhizi]|uniref:Expressed protein n=1 Tax=Phakopsora pachyrhizi TaxID=170000 RepID=A0AAV0AHJ0_PHAPC|nr:expressed protein [Phakopsora pachyrhizi]